MLAIGTGLLALVLSLVFWTGVGFVATIAHEGAHAVTASAMGGRVRSIQIERNKNGATASTGNGPLGAFFRVLSGHLGPSAFGLAGAALLTKDHVNAVLWSSLVFLVLAFVQAADWFTAFVMFLVGGVVGLVIHSTGAGLHAFFAYTWVWLLLFGGFGHIVASQRSGGMYADGSDAHKLRKMTFLPRSLWSGFFWLASVVAMVYGGCILLGIIDLGTLPSTFHGR